MMKKKVFLIVAAVLVGAALLFLGFRWNKKRIVYKGEEIREEQISSILQEKINSAEFSKIVESRTRETSSVEGLQDEVHHNFLEKEFQEFYELNGYTPVWLKFEGPQPATESLLTLLEKSAEEGFDPTLYHMAEIRDNISKLYPLEANEVDLDRMIKTDFMLTSAAMRYATHLRFGMIDPTRAAKMWKTYPETRSVDLSKYMADAVQNNKLDEAIKTFVPANPYYTALRKEAVRFAALKPWSPLKIEKTSPGDSSSAVLALRKRMQSESPKLDTTRAVYDEELEKIVRDFQARHGLETDGVVSGETLKALNISHQEKMACVRLNLERSRWIPFDSDFLLVNIPEYKFRIYKNGKKDLEMKVIVGKEYTSTPVFSDTMEHIIFSPTWGVPRSIATKEMLPTVKRNPGYLARNNYKVYRNGRSVDPSSVDWSSVSESSFNYQFVQTPGNHNALGHVKFMFPNSMNIYLHDTPTDHLFARNDRRFSHGCIRVEKPAELAEYLLKETGEWPMEKIKANFGMSSPKKVNLPEKLPVQIFYLTAWADENGKLHFRDDVYGHDEEHMKMLEAAATECKSNSCLIPVS